MSRVRLPADGCCLGLIQYFAGLDAFVKRVIKLGVTRTPAVSEPRTTATAAANFPRFGDDAAFGTYGTDERCRGCSRVYVGISPNMNTKTWKHENAHSMVCERILSPGR